MVISGCDVRLNTDAGIVVNGASGVTISGCDLTDNTSGTLGYGILVNGGSSDVNIDACDVRANGTNGIKIDGSVSAVSDIYIRNCNATGYSAYNVAINISSVTSNQGKVQVTCCAGYNDQGVTLTTTAPSSGTTFYSYSFGYYGPIGFYVTPIAGVTLTLIHIDSVLLHLTTGAYYIVPGESASITYTGAAGSPWFYAIGK